MNHFGIFYGMTVLAWNLLKSLFRRDTLIYRCPECNLVIRKYDEKCFRCKEIIDWGGIDEQK